MLAKLEKEPSYTNHIGLLVQLEAACGHFLRQLCALEPEQVAAVKVSAVRYSGQAFATYRRESPDAPDLRARTCGQAGGTTNYDQALMVAHDVAMSDHEQYDKIVVFFMSDGVPDAYPDGALRHWAANGKEIVGKLDFVAVHFGGAREAAHDLGLLANAFAKLGAAEACLRSCPTARDIAEVFAMMVSMAETAEDLEVTRLDGSVQALRLPKDNYHLQFTRSYLDVTLPGFAHRIRGEPYVMIPKATVYTAKDGGGQFKDIVKVEFREAGYSAYFLVGRTTLGKMHGDVAKAIQAIVQDETEVANAQRKKSKKNKYESLYTKRAVKYWVPCFPVLHS